MWIIRTLEKILSIATANQQEIKRMSQALDDLNAAVAALQTSVTNLQATANTVIADIAQLVAAGNDSAAIEAAVAKLKDSGTALDAANAALTASEPPPPAGSTLALRQYLRRRPSRLGDGVGVVCAACHRSWHVAQSATSSNRNSRKMCA